MLSAVLVCCFTRAQVAQLERAAEVGMDAAKRENAGRDEFEDEEELPPEMSWGMAVILLTGATRFSSTPVRVPRFPCTASSHSFVAHCICIALDRDGMMAWTGT
eukprot:COSAG05_NODE_2103_length_3555_cov_3.669271_4_plen_104_part_00